MSIFFITGCNSQEANVEQKKITVIHEESNNPIKGAEERLENNIAEATAVTYDSAEIFERVCSACHESIDEFAAVLPHGVSEEQVTTIIAEGLNDMPGFSTILKDEEIQAISKKIIETTTN